MRVALPVRCPHWGCVIHPPPLGRWRPWPTPGIVRLARDEYCTPSHPRVPREGTRATAARAAHFLPARLTGASTRFPGLGFVNGEGTTRELLALDPGDRGFGGLAVGHLDEPKAFRAPGGAVGNDTDRLHH